MKLKPVLKKGSRGDAVVELQTLLNSMASVKPKLVIDGILGAGTDRALKQFQREANLLADGIAGKRTWSALSQASLPNNDKISRYSFQPQSALADIARRYIGVTETGNNLAGDSKELLAIFKSDDLKIKGKTDGYPWCAAFVSYCIQKLCKQSPYFSGLIPPREASVNRLLTLWAKNNHCLIFTNRSKDLQPKKGDIVVFTFSHVGIIEDTQGATLRTIEGNTNDAGSREGTMVARKTRAKSLIRSYIRLPVSLINIPTQVETIAKMV